MKKWQKIATLAAALGLVLTATGCGNGNDSSSSSDAKDGDVELKVTTWNYDTTPEFEALFKAFEEKNPGVTIKPVDIAADNYDEKVTTMLSSGDTTDILTMKNLLSYSNYAGRNQLLDLTDHIKKDVDTEKSQGMYEQFDVDGKTYAQPYRTDFWVLYFNKTLFDEAGIEYPENLTWDEYEELAKKLSSDDSDNKVYGTYTHSWRSVIQAITAAQEDKSLAEPPYDYLKPAYERALRMQKDGSMMDYGTAKSTSVTYASQFETQKTAMMPMGSWYMAGVLNSKAQGKTDVDWGIAAMPQKQADGEITTFGSPTAFAINKNSKNAEMAQKFLDFASGEEGAKILANVGVVPSYKTDEIDELYFSKEGMPTDDISKAAFSPDVINIEFPVVLQGPAIDKILQEEHELIMVGDETPEKGISNMNKRVEQEIE